MLVYQSRRVKRAFTHTGLDHAIMKVILFGATGLAGRALLIELLKEGYKVTAFVRDPSKITAPHPHLDVIAGDVLQPRDVVNALDGHHAVISAISEGPTIVHHTQSRGNGNIIKAMQQAGMQRIIAMGSAGILQLDEVRLVRDVNYPQEYYPISEEQYNVFQQLQQSGLQWTQVCPPLILPQGSNGFYHTKKDYPPEGKSEVNAGNIGTFVAKELRENKYLQTRVGITNA